MATCAVTGTMTYAGTTAIPREGDIVAGGKTILLTLTGDTWVAAGATFDAERQAIINGLTSAQAEAAGWNAEVKAKEVVGAVVRTSDTLVTITLSAQAAYNITALDIVTVTVPGSALTGGAPITASPVFQVVPSPWQFRVRQTMGSDTTANGGATAALAWATIGQAVKAAASGGIAAGDTCYVGRGNYIGTVTPTTRASETFLIGDVTGQYTGDPGDVVISGGLPVAAAGGLNALQWDSANYWTLRNLLFRGGFNTSALGTHLTFEDCGFQRGASAYWSAALYTAFGTNLLVAFTRCVFEDGASLYVYMTRGTGADYDCGITFTNCVWTEDQGDNAVRIQTSGSGANYGGGILWRNCTFNNGSHGILLENAELSTTVPCAVYDSAILSAAGPSVRANTLGQLTETNNLLIGLTARTNVAIGTTSLASPLSSNVCAPHKPSRRYLRLSGTPEFDSLAMGFGNSAGAPTTDINGLPRPCGTMTYGDSGTATSAGNATLSDTSKTWGTDRWKGWTAKITGGTGAGQVKQINSNTGSQFTVSGNWKTNPSSDSTYVIYMGNRATTGKATAGAVDSCTDANAAWTVNQWTGWSFEVDAGTGNGDGVSYVTSNTATVLSFAARANALDNTSQYRMYRGTDENTVAPAAGAFERGDTMTREQTVVRTGSNALRGFGPCTQDFDLSIPAGASSLTIYGRYDSAYAGALPSMSVINGGECGVADAEISMVGAANTWELLTLNINAASPGRVTVRLQSKCTATLGSAYFDDFDVV